MQLRRTKIPHTLLILLSLIVLLSSCSSSSVTTDIPEEAQTEVGSIVGMPTRPSKNSLIFQAIIDVSADTTSDQTATATATTTDAAILAEPTPAFSPLCQLDLALDTPESGQWGTQVCQVQNADYLMGVLAVYLASCVDQNGVETVCDAVDGVTVASRETLYDGDPVDLKITKEQLYFPAAITDFQATIGFRVGGLQIVTSYLGHVFPDEATKPDEATMIVPYLRGKAYRICTTPHSQVDADTMAAHCGNAQAQFGDLLIDMDGDGRFGFFDVTLITPDAAVESQTRPDDYSLFVVNNIADITPTNYHGGLFATDTVFYDIAGYLAQALPFKNVYEFTNADVESSILTKLYTLGSLGFVDGARAIWEQKSICVAAVSPDACEEDADPASVGIYNPYYDLYPRAKIPMAAVEVVE